MHYQVRDSTTMKIFSQVLDRIWHKKEIHLYFVQELTVMLLKCMKKNQIMKFLIIISSEMT